VRSAFAVVAMVEMRKRVVDGTLSDGCG
jgi:hypothetical protein